jgi:hypothetical protein
VCSLLDRLASAGMAIKKDKTAMWDKTAIWDKIAMWDETAIWDKTAM